MKLNGAITETITAYINHTNSVLNGEGQLDTSRLDILGQLGILGSQSDASLKVEKAEPEPEGKQKRKYTTKPKDPNAPKRPLTAYFLFLQSVRPEINAELGKDQKRGDVAAEATRRWNELPDSTKEVLLSCYSHNVISTTANPVAGVESSVPGLQGSLRERDEGIYCKGR